MKNTLYIRLANETSTLLELTLPTELEAPALLGQLHAWTRPISQPSESAHPALSQVGKTYFPLAEYLSKAKQRTIRLSFQDIEQLIQKELPETARGKHANSWWANTETHSQGKAWLAVGWKVQKLELEDEAVEFRRQ